MRRAAESPSPSGPRWISLPTSAIAWRCWACRNPPRLRCCSRSTDHLGAGLDGLDRPQRSSWTWRGVPIPFVAYDDGWEPDDDPPRFRGGYEQSLRVAGSSVDAARIPVEAITADVLLAAGGDDQVWPSLEFARAIAARRSQAGRATRIVTEPGAGHRLILPGELVVTGGRRMARGGSEAADRALGALLWPHLLALLDPAVAASPLP